MFSPSHRCPGQNQRVLPPMEVEFFTITYNCRGLKQNQKRVKIFNYLKEKAKSGIFLLQETHSTEEEKNKLRIDWVGDLLLNHGTSNSRGTLIAFSKNLDYKLEKYETDNEGRIQICSIILKERKFLIINVYNENTEKEQVILLKKLDSLLEKFNENLDHEVILGGDFNFIMDKTLDAQGGPLS